MLLLKIYQLKSQFIELLAKNKIFSLHFFLCISTNQNKIQLLFLFRKIIFLK